MRHARRNNRNQGLEMRTIIINRIVVIKFIHYLIIIGCPRITF